MEADNPIRVNEHEQPTARRCREKGGYWRRASTYFGKSQSAQIVRETAIRAMRPCSDVRRSVALSRLRSRAHKVE
eukprot:1414515-Pleurochrysis_carterae.AAC.1